MQPVVRRRILSVPTQFHGQDIRPELACRLLLARPSAENVDFCRYIYVDVNKSKSVKWPDGCPENPEEPADFENVDVADEFRVVCGVGVIELLEAVHEGDVHVASDQPL